MDSASLELRFLMNGATVNSCQDWSQTAATLLRRRCCPVRAGAAANRLQTQRLRTSPAQTSGPAARSAAPRQAANGPMRLLAAVLRMACIYFAL